MISSTTCLSGLKLLIPTLILLPVLFFACRTTRPVAGSSPDLVQSLQLQIDTNRVFGKSFTGFALFDPVRKELILSRNGDKYFTPASNTKIFTLYAGLSLLGDSIPGLRYLLQGDSLIFWGTGDPSLLNRQVRDSSRVIQFLRQRTEKLFFCPVNFADEPFGAGWAWDDYHYAYQVEKSGFPIYGNRVLFRGLGFPHFEVLPPYFKPFFKNNYTSRRVERSAHGNQFFYDLQRATAASFERAIPFKYDPELITKLLEAELHKPVNLLEIPLLPGPAGPLVYSVPVDSLYVPMMQRSDNFLAEQLLLLCSEQLFGYLNTRRTIQYVKDSLLAGLPHEPIWADGSGLSRYNLFTPRTIVDLLDRIRHMIPEERLFRIFPAGGQSGTIAGWYSASTPYVFAKTGTLRNKHCLSGYLKTKKGATLIFSFMHNNYISGSNPLKVEMEKILRFIYEHY